MPLLSMPMRLLRMLIQSRIFLCVFVSGLCCLTVSAAYGRDDIDVLCVDYTVSGQAGAAHPRAGTFEEQLRVSAFLREIQCAYPVVLEENTSFLIHSLSMQNLSLRYKEWDTSREPGSFREFYGFEYGCALRRNFSESCRGIFFVRPAICSDFEKTTIEDVRVSGGVIIEHRRNSGGWYGVGMACSGGKDSSLLFPLFRYSGSAAPEESRGVSINIVAPVKAEIFYACSDKVDVGIACKVNGNRYYLHDNRSVGTSFEYLLVTFGPAVRWHSGENVQLRLDAGTSLFHRLRIYEGSQIRRSIELEPQWVVKAGLYFLI